MRLYTYTCTMYSVHDDQLYILSSIREQSRRRLSCMLPTLGSDTLVCFFDLAHLSRPRRNYYGQQYLYTTFTTKKMRFCQQQ